MVACTAFISILLAGPPNGDGTVRLVQAQGVIADNVPVVPSTATPARMSLGGDFQSEEFMIHVPPGASEPLTVLVALHGMGGNGDDISRSIRSRTDAQGWVVVAPTLNYGNWTDPSVVTQEATAHYPRLNALLDRLPTVIGSAVKPKVLLYGFSRGSQAANRYALAFPERVAGAALISGGTYTIPYTSVRNGESSTTAPFPYGVANLEQVFGRPFDADAFRSIPFWIAVGSTDNDPNDVPHQWDPYIGRQRVERAQQFANLLQQDGCQVEVHVVNGMGHNETDAVRAGAIEFLARFS